MSRSSLIVSAGPGTGKTSTILAAINHCFVGVKPAFPPSKEQKDFFNWVKTNSPKEVSAGGVVVLAYNKTIADEIQDDITFGSASTIHSMGAKLCWKYMSRPKMNKFKTGNSIVRAMDSKSFMDLSREQKDIVTEVTTVVSAAKDMCLLPTDITKPGLQKLLVKKGLLDLETRPAVLQKYVTLCLAEALEDRSQFDFDDMVYLPVINGWKNSYDVLFIDEAQDLSHGRQRLITQQDCDCLIFVGDRNQSIYAFAGADCESIETITRETEAEEIPLSTSWRCSKAIVDHAKKYLSYGDLSPSPQAKEGEVLNMEEDQLIPSLQKNDLVLCRTNAPIISLAWKAIRDGVPVQILGNNLKEGLVSLLKNEEKYEYNNLLSRLDSKIEKQIEKVSKRPWDTTMQVEALKDKMLCMSLIYDKSTSVEGMRKNINKLFSSKSPIKLCSIHRSKGLEANRVFWLHPENTPHPMAKTQEAMAQETNLQFVATTRAKNSLFLVPKKQKCS